MTHIPLWVITGLVVGAAIYNVVKDSLEIRRENEVDKVHCHFVKMAPDGSLLEKPIHARLSVAKDTVTYRFKGDYQDSKFVIPTRSIGRYGYVFLVESPTPLMPGGLMSAMDMTRAYDMRFYEAMFDAFLDTKELSRVQRFFDRVQRFFDRVADKFRPAQRARIVDEAVLDAVEASAFVEGELLVISKKALRDLRKYFHIGGSNV